MKHYVKTVQILSCFELFSPNTKCFVFGLKQENTDQKKLRICTLFTPCNKYYHLRKTIQLLVMVLLASIGEQVLLIIRHK